MKARTATTPNDLSHQQWTTTDRSVHMVVFRSAYLAGGIDALVEVRLEEVRAVKAIVHDTAAITLRLRYQFSCTSSMDKHTHIQTR